MSIPIRLSSTEYTGNGVFTLIPSKRLEFFDQNLALTRLSMRNVIQNVASQYYNQYVSWSVNGTQYSTTIPAGYYQPSDLAEYFGSIANNCLTITYNANTDLCTISVFGTSASITFSQQFGALLGFAGGVYSVGTYTASTPRQDPVQYVQMNTLDSLTNSDPMNKNIFSLAAWSPKEVPFGSAFVYEPHEPLWLPIVDGSYPQIRVSIVDQSNNLVNLDTSCIVIDLVVKPRGKGEALLVGY